MTYEDLDVFARTIYGEARGERHAGRASVAHVVVNRVKLQGWYGRTLAGVCLKPRQFSCWNGGDSNRRAVEAAHLEDTVFLECVGVAARVLAGAERDPTSGATHYHVRGIMPAWARDRQPCAAIGNHIFYRITD